MLIINIQYFIWKPNVISYRNCILCKKNVNIFLFDLDCHNTHAIRKTQFTKRNVLNYTFLFNYFASDDNFGMEKYFTEITERLNDMNVNKEKYKNTGKKKHERIQALL